MITNKIWNLTSEIHLTLTEWKPIPYIFPIRTTVTDKASERDCGRRCNREKGQSVIDKRNTRNEKNDQTQRERNTVSDMDETRADGDDDDEVGYSEDGHGEDEDGAGSGGDWTVSHSKR